MGGEEVALHQVHRVRMAEVRNEGGSLGGAGMDDTG